VTFFAQWTPTPNPSGLGKSQNLHHRSKMKFEYFPLHKQEQLEQLVGAKPITTTTILCPSYVAAKKKIPTGKQIPYVKLW
jgi:hypothetical protein